MTIVSRYCHRTKRRVPPGRRRVSDARSDLAAPIVHSDDLGYMESMADGKIYTSKSKYLSEVRARGYEVKGDQRDRPNSLPDMTPQGVEADIKQTLEEMGK